MKKKMLFISWDGSQTNYMIGLFIPIFKALVDYLSIEMHIIQFSWSDDVRIKSIKKNAEDYGIFYSHYKINRKHSVMFGSLFAIFFGSMFVAKYINKHHINVVMPRSIFPALILYLSRVKNKKIIYDADGLSLEEKIDFGNLTRKSLRFKFLKAIETQMIKRSDVVLTRSEEAIKYYHETINCKEKNKFFVVINGKDEKIFNNLKCNKEKFKKELGILSDEIVFIYTGSLGKQYGWKDMMRIFNDYLFKNKKAKFIILTGNIEYAIKNIPSEIKSNIIIKNVLPNEVPCYLDISDIAFAIRKPSISMKGVSPIKLGEYLLMGLPTIASKGIGDTEAVLKNINYCYLYDYHKKDIENVLDFIIRVNKIDKKIVSSELRKHGINYYSKDKMLNSYSIALKNIF